MIIDIHSHIAFHKIFPQLFIDEVIEGINSESPIKLEPEKKRLFFNTLIRGTLNDEKCEKLIKQMKEAQIEKTVLLVTDFGFGMGEAPLSIEEIYELFSSVLNQNKEKFVVFAGIDPRRGSEGYRLFEKGICKLGFKGLKLYPPCGFELDDKELMPYFEICDTNHLPVLIHTGISLKSMRNQQNYPQSMLEISKRYKNISFILGHGAIKDYSNNFMLATSSDNIYLDLSGFQQELSDIKGLKKKLGDIAEQIPEKILFGTDWPMFALSGSQKRWVEEVERLEVFNESNLEKLYCSNAKKILNL